MGVLKCGDVVKVKGQAQKLTVDAMMDDENQKDHLIVICIWFDKDNCLCKASFGIETLVYVY